MELVTEIVGGEEYAYYPLGQYVVRAPGVCGGRPTFKYTRIEVVRALNRLNGGESVDHLIRSYRGLITREALAFICKRPALEAGKETSLANKTDAVT